jgi:TolA-binding protein
VSAAGSLTQGIEVFAPITKEKGNAVKRIFRIFILILLPIWGLSGQTMVTDEVLRQGLSELRSGRLEEASTAFQAVLNDPNLEPFHPDALYWLIKTSIPLEQYETASLAADRYMVMYPGHGRQEEVVYQRSRILFLENEPEDAIVALGDFIDEYPNSEFVPSAKYWIGESLIVLGRLEEADAVFEMILEDYPNSVKREASRYRRSEIALLFRERELLNLLKWSHEEHLQDAEEFFRRENEYRDAVASYRERWGSGSGSDELTLYRTRLLEIKERLLKLERYYVEQLLGLANVQP